jgi:hypothetical protein
MRKRFKGLAFLAILSIGLVPRLFIALGSVDSLVQFVPDDAFYYLQVARQIVVGNGSTFDGIYPANGYHPLWMFLLLPLAALPLDSELHLRAAALLGVTLNFIGAVFLFAFLKRLAHSFVLALVGASLYFLNLPAIFSSVNVLETSLSSLLLVILLLLCHAQILRPSVSWFVGAGAVLGMFFLARTDNTFFIIAFAFVIFYRADTPGRVVNVLATTITASMLIAPWILWNWVEFGSPVQTSGLAMPYVLHENFIQSGHTVAQSLEWSALFFLDYLLLAIHSDLGFPFLIYQATILYTFLAIAKHWRDDWIRQNRTMRAFLVTQVALWAAALVLIFVHTFVRWYPRSWYFDPLIILSCTTFIAGVILVRPQTHFDELVAGACRRLFSSVPLKTIGIGLCLVFTLALSVGGVIMVSSQPPYSHQTEMLDAANWLKTNMRSEDTAASFNSGIMAFFSDRRIVNLDGTINGAAYKAILRRELWQLMRESNVSYFLDYDPVMLELYKAFLGDGRPNLKLIQTIDRPGVEWGGAAIHIYSVNW